MGLMPTCLKFELLGCRQSGQVLYFQSLEYGMSKEVGYVSEIFDDRTLLTNLGFPYQYKTNQVYKWLITYPDKHYIKLIFTHIELNAVVEPTMCKDILKISNHIADSEFVRQIDQDFNHVIKDSLAIETKESQLILSFETCPYQLTAQSGKGFSSFVTYENIPACFSLRPRILWNKGLREICRQSIMLITSMAFLGFPFLQTTEQWTINNPTKRIHLQIISFYVPCKNVYYKSEFKIIDIEDEKVYCNINKPPKSIKSSFDNITVYFYKGTDPWPKLPHIEGFRIVYSAIAKDEEEENGILINQTALSKG
ncbi:uncharacterized protein LOC132742181 [Ruditapes philippinarum]|uniref:uncharacterized protein LOC132742181 n=1 Tax=Ruditapes philippinarum TaxID=129788 RepID=UPI00295BB13C|nr:uncharacterized protein LOC132742181 [Ruditapes philippinarum]